MNDIYNTINKIAKTTPFCTDTVRMVYLSNGDEEKTKMILSTALMTNVSPEILIKAFSAEYVENSKKLMKEIKNRVWWKRLIRAIKNELYRKSPWDNGYRLVIVGAIPLIIIMVIYFVLEHFK